MRILEIKLMKAFEIDPEYNYGWVNKGIARSLLGKILFSFLA